LKEQKNDRETDNADEGEHFPILFLGKCFQQQE
jgi:hypothetical protein